MWVSKSQRNIDPSGQQLSLNNQHLLPEN